MKKKYTKKQILESIKYWKKQLKKLDESTQQHYVVDVKSPLGNISEEYDVDSLEELASQIRAKLAWMNGAEDDINTGWIPFEYISVEDEYGNDVTEEANASK